MIGDLTPIENDFITFVKWSNESIMVDQPVLKSDTITYLWDGYLEVELILQKDGSYKEMVDEVEQDLSHGSISDYIQHLDQI